MSLLFPNSRSSLLYIEVWKIRWKLPAHQKRVVWSLIKSLMILCMIWLLSYEGAILNPFQVWRNTGACIAVVLVLLQTQNRVMEVVVVHFIQLSFLTLSNKQASNDFKSIWISRCFMLLVFCNDRRDWILWTAFEASILPASDDLQLLMIFRTSDEISFWWSCFWWRQLLMYSRTTCL